MRLDPKRVRHVRERHQPRVRREPFVDFSVARQAVGLESHRHSPGMQAPGHKVGVMLQRGDYDLVFALQSQPVGHKVDSLGGITCKDDFRGRGTDESGDFLAGAFESVRRFLGEHMHAPVYVCCVFGVEAGDRVDHALRLGCG